MTTREKQLLIEDVEDNKDLIITTLQELRRKKIKELESINELIDFTNEQCEEIKERIKQ